MMEACTGGPRGERFRHWLLRQSLKAAGRERRFGSLVARLRSIEPEIVPPSMPYRDHWEYKRRLLHAFQCSLLLRALEGLPRRKLTVVDIGAGGAHMRYLRELAAGSQEIESVEVNLDPAAVARIRSQGRRAVLCRGEELRRHLGDEQIDLFTAFETIEHLHNPALFFYRLARDFSCDMMVVSTPYQRRSRVGLFHVRQDMARKLTAEQEHIFELSPEDWTLLLRHAGWKVAHAEVFRQYPCRLPLARALLARLWRRTEFEGFWGAILVKDTTFADCYQDWEERT